MNTPGRTLEGKIALVTGASRGIGEAIAHGFAAEGAQVILAARKIDGLTQVAQAIRERGGTALALACHTGKPEEIDLLMKTSIAEYGRIDVLVNNAATNPYFGPMLDLEWAAWDKTFEVNVKGYFATARAVARHLIERGQKGSIINVASIIGIQASPLQGIYGMTKAAVISMTKTLAVELGPQGIRVNAIAPGFIETRFSRALIESEPISQSILERTPLGRIGKPDDITALALYLASDASSFVTGAVMVADGGLTAG